jgi:DNA-binding transcriptional LysR family regulator
VALDKEWVDFLVLPAGPGLTGRAAMKLSQLRHLIAVVEAGTVRRAAKALFLSQSSVTKSIHQLEQSLGVELLHRHAHGVTPTAAGRALIARAKVIEAELREARNDLDVIQGARGGEIRVGVSPAVAMSLLPRAILDFKRARPKVRFHIQEGVYPDVLAAVRTGDLDFVVCLVPESPRDEELTRELLLRDRVTPAVRAGHPLARSRQKLASLSKVDWVLYRRERTGRDIFESIFVAAGLEPPAGTIESASFACALMLVEQGDYVVLVPRQLFASSSPLRLGLVPLTIDSPMPSWSVAVYYRSQHELSPVCRRFLEQLRETARAAAAPRQPARS